MSQHGTNNFRFALSKAASSAFSISDNFLREIEKNVTYMVILLLYVIQQYIYLFLPLTACYLRGFCAYEMTTYVRSISYMPILFCTRCYSMHSQILVKIRFSGSTFKVKGYKRFSCERITFRVLRDKVHIFREGQTF